MPDNLRVRRPKKPRRRVRRLDDTPEETEERDAEELVSGGGDDKVEGR